MPGRPARLLLPWALGAGAGVKVGGGGVGLGVLQEVKGVANMGCVCGRRAETGGMGMGEGMLL